MSEVGSENDGRPLEIYMIGRNRDIRQPLQIWPTRHFAFEEDPALIETL